MKLRCRNALSGSLQLGLACLVLHHGPQVRREGALSAIMAAAVLVPRLMSAATMPQAAAAAAAATTVHCHLQCGDDVETILQSLRDGCLEAAICAEPVLYPKSARQQKNLNGIIPGCLVMLTARGRPERRPVRR